MAESSRSDGQSENGRMNWQFLQCFGEHRNEDDVQEVDIISTLSFDRTGEYLATGDCGGRVVLFESKKAHAKAISRGKPVLGLRSSEYRYMTEIQSHLPEFDYLKSLEVEEKINSVRWCHSQPGYPLSLLSTNDKTIKLWKIAHRKVHKVGKFNCQDSDLIGTEVSGGRHSSPPPSCVISLAQGSESVARLKLPEVLHTSYVLSSRCARVFGNVHPYHINSLSVNSDGETFLSADDLRVHLWRMDIEHTSFNILDIKPERMEDLSEVITSCEFHPVHCNIFGYSSCKGLVRLVDMRVSARAECAARQLGPSCSSHPDSMFSEVLNSITDLQFGLDGHTVVTRDFLELKIWDARMENGPVTIHEVHPHIKSKLYDLYEHDCLFDKFRCGVNREGTHVVTGSYNNLFRIFGSDGSNQWLEISRSELSTSPYTPLARAAAESGAFNCCEVESQSSGADIPSPKKGENEIADADVINQKWHTKLLQTAWHPHDKLVAIASTNSLFLFKST